MKFSALSGALAMGIASSFMLAGCVEETEPKNAADMILTGGYIYTVDADRSVAEAIAIKGNKIVAVGDVTSVMQHKGDSTVVRDLEGKMVLPGLHDMHIHAMGSVTPDMCDLDSVARPLDELVPVIKECVEKYANEEGKWMPVLQWNPFEGNQPSEQFPTIRAALDAAAPHNPIIMWGNDGHHGAVNSAALASLDVPINAETLETTYADYKILIAVDEKGEPTGGMTEEARNLVRADMDADMLGLSTPVENLMPRVAAKMASNGLTSIQDAAVTENVLENYLWLEKSGGMTFRVRTALLAHMEDHHDAQEGKVPAVMKEINALREKAKGAKFVRSNAMKIFADGVMEGNPYAEPPTLPNAALLDGFLQPIFTVDSDTGNADVTGYVDLEGDLCKQVQADIEAYKDTAVVEAFKAKNGFFPVQCLKSYGKLELSAGDLKALVQAATEEGYHIHIHAIADHAVRISIDAYEAVKETADAKGVTQSVAHVQIAKSEDVKRLGKLGAYVAFTYNWATPEPEYEMVVIPFVDEVKGLKDLYNHDHYYMKNAYPFRTVLKSGGVPVFGSDTPVGSRNPRPFENMATALTRSNGDDLVLNASETLDIHETIASYTINSAMMMDHDDKLGSLEVGKLADIVILDHNLVDRANVGDYEAIERTKVLTTIFDGKVVYEAEAK